MHYVTLFPDHPGMTDSAAILAAPLPWNDNAARAAYCVDAPGRPCVVELFRVPGRRSGGEQYLPHEAGEACPCEGRAPRVDRLGLDAR